MGVYCIISDIDFFCNNRVLCLFGDSGDFTLNIYFSGCQMRTVGRVMLTPTDATANLEMSEQFQENEQDIDRPTEQGDAAAYAALDHSNMQENHAYDVIS